MNAYGIITQTLHVEADQESIDWVNRTYLKRFTYIRAFVAVVCLISIIASFSGVGTWVSFSFLGLGVLGLVFMQFYKRSIAKNLVATRNSDCDPVLYCRRYLALIKNTKADADPMEGIFNYAMGLYWIGDWGGAERLMGTMAGNLQTPRNAYLFHHLMAYCAWVRRDPVQLGASITALEALPPKSLTGEMLRYIDMHRMMATLLDCETSGRFTEGMQIIGPLFEYPNISTAQRAMLAIHAAYCSTERDEATRWLEYAAKFGGTTWCATEAKRLLTKTE